MNYKIMRANNTSDLTEKVRVMLKNGWVTVGGVCWDGQDYLQAMGT